MERGRCDERRLIQLKQTTGIAALNARLSRKTRLASLLQQTSYDSQRQRCEGHYGTGQICGGVPWSVLACFASAFKRAYVFEKHEFSEVMHILLGAAQLLVSIVESYGWLTNSSPRRPYGSSKE